MIQDLRKKLPKDPAATVEHGCGGQHPATQRVVFMNEGLADAVIATVTAVSELEGTTPAFVAVGCTKGEHRAQVTALTIQDVLNSVIDFEGDRIYNCMVFHLNDCKKKAEYSTIYDTCERWGGEPWCVVECAPLSAPIKERFAYQSAICTPQGAANWKAIWDQVQVMFPDSIVEAVKQIEPDANVEDVVEVDEGVGDVVRLVPHEPVNPPPEWFTFENKVQVWWDVLTAKGCDERCLQEIACLAQLGEAGYEHANHVISKVFKKESDGEEIENVSAFIHTRITNARHQLMNEGGKSWSGQSWNSGSWRRQKWSDEWRSDARGSKDGVNRQQL